MQFQADMLGVPVARPKVIETTALGAACLAGLAVGFWQDTAELVQMNGFDRKFTPQPAGEALRENRLEGWKQAVSYQIKAN